jgi:hypothetical protein
MGAVTIRRIMLLVLLAAAVSARAEASEHAHRCRGVRTTGIAAAALDDPIEVDLGVFTLVMERSTSPEDSAYVVELVEAVLPDMVEVLGPPVSVDRLTVSLEKNSYGGIYSCYDRTIYMDPIYNWPRYDDDHDGRIDEDPFDGVDNDGDGLVDEDPANSRVWDQLFVHELAHAFQDDLICGRYPSWFEEGMADAAMVLVADRLASRMERDIRSTRFDVSLGSDDLVDRLGAPILGGNDRLVDRDDVQRSYASARNTFLIPCLAEIAAGRDHPMARLTATLREAGWTGRENMFRAVDRAFRTPVDGIYPPSRWMQRRSVVCPSVGDGTFLGIVHPWAPVNPDRLGVLYFSRQGYRLTLEAVTGLPVYTGVHGERARPERLVLAPELSLGAWRVDQTEPRDDGTTLTATSWVLQVHPEVLTDDVWSGVAAVFVDGDGNPVEVPDLAVDGTIVERVPGGCIAEPLPEATSLTFRGFGRVLGTVTVTAPLPRLVVLDTGPVSPRGVITWSPYRPHRGGTVTAALHRAASALGRDEELTGAVLTENGYGAKAGAESLWTGPGDLAFARFTVPPEFEIGELVFEGSSGSAQDSPGNGVMVTDAAAPGLTGAHVEGANLVLAFDGPADPVAVVIDLAEASDGPWRASGEALGPDPRNESALIWPIPAGDTAPYVRVRAGDEVLCTLRLGARPAVVRHVAYAPFPNPSRLGAQWRVDLAGPMDATFVVLDVAGGVVHGPEHRHLQAGRNDLWWDGRLRGRPVAAGVYFLRLNAPGVALRSKLVLLPR